MHSFEIDLAQSGRGSLLMDGEPLTGVRAITVHGSIDGLTTIELEMIAERVIVTADGVEMTETTDLNSNCRMYQRVAH